MMKEEIRAMLGPLMPLVNLDADYLFAELDSLDITAILMTLSQHYGISLEAEDVTPRNFKNLDALAEMVRQKLNAKEQAAK